VVSVWEEASRKAYVDGKAQAWRPHNAEARHNKCAVHVTTNSDCEAWHRRPHSALPGDVFIVPRRGIPEALGRCILTEAIAFDGPPLFLSPPIVDASLRRSVDDSLVAGPRRVEGDGSEKGQRPSNEPLEVKAVAKP
jgi:hypothetical protein